METYQDYLTSAKRVPFLFEWDYEIHVPVITAPSVIPEIVIPGYMPYVLGTHGHSVYDVTKVVRGFDVAAYGASDSLLSILRAKPHSNMAWLVDGRISIFDGVMNRPRFMLSRHSGSWDIVPVFTEEQLRKLYGLTIPECLADNEVVDLSMEFGLDELFEFEDALLNSRMRDDEEFLATNRPAVLSPWHVVDMTKDKKERIHLYAFNK